MLPTKRPFSDDLIQSTRPSKRTSLLTLDYGLEQQFYQVDTSWDIPVDNHLPDPRAWSLPDNSSDDLIQSTRPLKRTSPPTLDYGLEQQFYQVDTSWDIPVDNHLTDPRTWSLPDNSGLESCAASWDIPVDTPLPELGIWSPPDDSEVAYYATSSTTPQNDDEVCFGMVCGVNVKFVEGLDLESLHLNTDSPSPGHLQLNIAMKRIHILQTDAGAEIGILNANTSKVVQELDEKCRGCCFKFYVTFDEWTNKTRLVAMEKSVCFHIEMHINGPASLGIGVGKILSDHGHFLQEPDFLSSSIPYNNPHEIVFPTLEDTSPLPTVPDINCSAIDNTSEDAINTILGGLDHGGSLDALPTEGNVIKTELKPHQRMALDFITKRESGQVLGALSLFKQCTDSRNRKYYENTVTGSRTPEKPIEAFGGIIADEMGLGKTLTMLSAIVSTTAKAREHQPGGAAGCNTKSRLMGTRATLVICPSVLLMDGWMNEVSKHIQPTFLTCVKYHGTSKATKADILDSDVVLTTYSTLIADAGQGRILQGFHWYRIVLDEAHSIRNNQTKQFRAVTSLSAEYRWCLTGTPIQNSLSDLGALVCFLRVPRLQRIAEFEHQIAGPIERRDAEGLRKLQSLLQSICLRRTQDFLGIARPEFRVEHIQLTSEEKHEYRRIGDIHRVAIEHAVRRGDWTEARSQYFRGTLKLRMFCNSGLCVHHEQATTTAFGSSPSLEQETEAVCAYCSCYVSAGDDFESSALDMALRCPHLLCPECMDLSKKGQRKNGIRCVVCGTVTASAHASRKGKFSNAAEAALQPTGNTSKLRALAHNILQHPGEKCIVFSEWRTSIRVAATYLTNNGIPVCIVDGSTSLPHRRTQIERFQQDPTICALLITLGTGAVGLNLTVANRIHILEPQWNPSTEKQAIGRVTRLGQERKVTVVRYVVENSIELRVQNRQEKKTHLTQLAWNNAKLETEAEKLQKSKDMLSQLTME